MGSEADRERIRRLLDDVENDAEEFDVSDPEEEDNVTETFENTDTEQEGTDNEMDIEEDVPIPAPEVPRHRVPVYIGKDQTTQWKMHRPPVRSVRTRQNNIVIHLPGVKGDARNAKTPIDCWKLFFDDQIMNTILENTNLYIEKCRPNYSRDRAAQCTDMVELKALFGLLYLAGILKSSRLNLKELWDRDGNGVEKFWLVMSRERFMFLLKHIRFDNTDTREERRVVDKFAPIRDIFDKFTENCKKNYTISEYGTIDEMLLAFRGRCSFRQYMPKKPNKYGLKLFLLVDAKTRYMLCWEPYVGKQPLGPFRQETNAHNVVTRLITPISGTGRNITVDNYFTSFPLINQLNDHHKLTVVGTVRKNKRELPPLFVNTKERPVNSSLFGFQENVTICSYVPKKGKNVILASSMHHDDAIDETTEQFKPEVIVFYNSTKGGVDTLDELCALYDVARNTRRWPMVIFFGLMNVAGVNSQIIFTSNNIETNTSRRIYLRQLSNALTSEHQQRRAVMTNLPPEVRLRRQEAAGVAVQAMRADQLPEGTRKRCHLCRKESKTRYYCKHCLKFICLKHASFSCPTCPNAD